ncbi:MAG: 4Fe-4S dicluster domain-containing protein [bacterium]|nr:4Fe-4S dicluster domain-containing protein [bacterium]
MVEITVDANLCIHCGSCVQACPQNLFAQAEADAVPNTTDLHRCISCGHCVAICPKDAVAHTDFPAGSITPLDDNQSPSTEQVMHLLRARRSVRTFTDEPVERQTIEQLVEAARCAPSAHNHQGTGIIAITDPALLRTLVDLTAAYLGKNAKMLSNTIIAKTLTLLAPGMVKNASELLEDIKRVSRLSAEGDDLILHNAPALMVFHGPVYVSFAEADANLALHNATLVAHTLGLGSFYTGYFAASAQDDKAIQKTLNLPPKHRVYGGLALGHPKLSFRHRIQRKPVDVVWR